MKSKEVKKTIRKIEEVLGEKPVELKKKKSLEILERLDKKKVDIIKKIDKADSSTMKNFAKIKEDLIRIQKSVKDITVVDNTDYTNHLEDIIGKLSKILEITKLIEEKNDKEELKSITDAIKKIKIPDQRKDTADIIQAIKEGKEEKIKLKDYSEMLDRLLNKLTEIHEENKR